MSLVGERHRDHGGPRDVKPASTSGRSKASGLFKAGTPTPGQLAIDVTYKAWLLLSATRKVSPDPNQFRSARFWIEAAIEHLARSLNRPQADQPGTDPVVLEWTRQLMLAMAGREAHNEIPRFVESAIAAEVRALVNTITGSMNRETVPAVDTGPGMELVAMP